MAGETAAIAEMAKKVSEDLFKFYKWDFVDLYDQNFPCHKLEKHTKDKTSHTHPVDVVLGYIDPYLNRKVLFNTDLKSYAKGSLTSYKVRQTLKSLAHTISCANSSDVWQDRYILEQEINTEIRGMLFTYNHDGGYEKKFFDYFDPGKKDDNKGSVSVEGVPLDEDMMIHIIDPLLIQYMTTVKHDISTLSFDNKFPRGSENFSFFYPELHLHKTGGDKKSRPATVEMLSAPFMIIEHESTKVPNSQGVLEEVYERGYIVYCNIPFSNVIEFEYLFDVLSKYQMLDDGHSLRIRVAHHHPHQNLESLFQTAKTNYINSWQLTSSAKLDRIELKRCNQIQTTFSEIEIGWEM